MPDLTGLRKVRISTKERSWMWWLQERFLEMDMCVVIDKEVGGYRFALCFRRLEWQWTQLA